MHLGDFFCTNLQHLLWLLTLEESANTLLYFRSNV
nr:MAG TPA: hypothetical protein [Bacteriophage sp.]